MAAHDREDWFEREEFIGQLSDIRVQNLQVERELVQKRTFTRWINLHLERVVPPIEVHDLFHDIQDGHILLALLEELSGCKLLHGFKKSTHRIFRLNNISKVLAFLQERNVKLISIDAANVVDGNPSIILGLIWNIILFFQIKELTANIKSQFCSTSSLSSAAPSQGSAVSPTTSPLDGNLPLPAASMENRKAIKKLLQWVQNQTRRYGISVQDFGKSWTSGLCFLALIKSIDPTLVDLRKALLRSPRENIEEAFRIAHYSLGIPCLLEPADVLMTSPDEQSIITYVSQFLEHFSGGDTDSVYPLRKYVCDCDVNMDRLKTGGEGRVKETSRLFQKNSIKAQPKISRSLSLEDRIAVALHSTLPMSASLSKDDCVEGDSADSVTECNSSYNSQQSISDSHLTPEALPLTSVSNDFMMGDSAAGSPDSGLEVHYSLVPESFCHGQSSVCDSGIPCETQEETLADNIDEGFVSIADIRTTAVDKQDAEYIDDGQFSNASTDGTQGRLEDPMNEKQKSKDEVKETAGILPSPEPLEDMGVDFAGFPLTISDTEQELEREDQTKWKETDQDIDQRRNECCLLQSSDQTLVNSSLAKDLKNESEVTEDVEGLHSQQMTTNGSSADHFPEHCNDTESSANGNEHGSPAETPAVPILATFDASNTVLLDFPDEPSEQPTEPVLPELPTKLPDSPVLKNIPLNIATVEQDGKEIDGWNLSEKEKPIKPSPVNDFPENELHNEEPFDCTAGQERDLSDLNNQCASTKEDKTQPTFATDSIAVYFHPDNSSEDKPMSSPKVDPVLPLDEPLSDHLEPMDLFYPDQKDNLSSQPADDRMQHTPLFLSVSALDPAPSEEPENPSVHLPYKEAVHDALEMETNLASVTEDKINGLSEIQSQPNVIDDPDCQHVSLSSSREDLMPLKCADGSSQHREGDFAPVQGLRRRRHRTESREERVVMKVATADTQEAELDLCWNKNGEQNLLLFLWLMLYCFWLLPQMDLKSFAGWLPNRHV